MQPITIGIKELHGKLGKVAAATKRGGSFLVMRHHTPVFRIEPVASAQKKTYTLGDIASLMFHNGHDGLSTEVDAAAYGV